MRAVLVVDDLTNIWGLTLDFLVFDLHTVLLSSPY